MFKELLTRIIIIIIIMIIIIVIMIVMIIVMKIVMIIIMIIMIMHNGKLFLPITMMCILDATYYTQECVPARTYLLNHDHLSPLILQSLFLRM